MKYEILGLFPNISLERFGGVELSGRLAWQAIQEYSVPRKMATQLFCYVPGATHAENINEIIVRSKFAAARILLTRAFAPRVILVWHLGLLKLLPFVRVPRARVIVFLHGIEAGAPFASAHTFFQTGPFRPRNLARGIENVVFTGSGTQPGVGVPMVLISGKLAAQRIIGK